ncbi:putative phosphatase [Nostoc sp. PCC 7524]|uniref:alkaline phosphatase PhoX n=1 Tax=Nostoc sp. (strain ATCC 29411 / PCC 7524) TaxID=28072 RepID=UPI00029F466C|nr:alkaline phosphatase PhoX [Nostoc sp. PCC 7524]AFY51085.1 putative phosphatase [Nostoc sp. PCC 7524]
MAFSRRKFFTLAGATAAGTLAASPLEGLLARAAFGQVTRTTTGYGPLIPDPNPTKFLDLPEGFQYRVISLVGNIMADGNPAPGNYDGMAAFPGPRGTTILVCNHELTNTSSTQIIVPNRYDPVSRGGTTTMVVGRNRELIKQFASLGGTIRNCAGGPTPWGSWITCEENTSVPDGSDGSTQFHGYNFEVPANANGPVDPVPLKDMGRFNHEAVAVDPVTGIVYQTEDRGNGCFYRFIPNVPGKLAEGGSLQALRIGTISVNTGGSDLTVGQKWSVDWVDIENPDPATDTVREEGRNAGAATFARGEGIWYDGRGDFYFCCTSGGPGGLGQVFRYTPATETLELFVQSPSADALRAPDNIVVAPFGDLILCEDKGISGSSTERQRLIGVTPQGELYEFARNAFGNGRSEFAGACFSPDGQTMFVNIYSGVTLAIWGPWNAKRA